MLDVLAGVSEDKMIECHGHFRTSSCTKCSRTFDGKECKRVIVEDKQAPKCLNCGGYVKPDIVFFGESLPNKFHKLVKQDTKNADLLIVMGTCECCFVIRRNNCRRGKVSNSSFSSTHGWPGQYDSRDGTKKDPPSFVQQRIGRHISKAQWHENKEAEL